MNKICERGLNMKKEDENKSPEFPLIIFSYIDKDFNKSPSTFEDAEAIDPKKYDVFIDCPHSKIIVRDKKGKQHGHNGDIKGVGYVRLSVLKKLVAAKPARFHRPYDFGLIGEYIESHFIKDCLISYVSHIRKNLLHEDGYNPRILLTTKKPFTIGLNGDLNYCLIDWASSQQDEG